MFPTRLAVSLLLILNILHVALFFPHLAHSLHFSIPQFNPDETNNIAYDGDAESNDTSIELNSVKLSFSAGRATYIKPLRLWNSHTSQLADFTTKFCFTIDTLTQANFSDGFAFFMASLGYPTPSNSGGGYLGLFNGLSSTGNDFFKHQIFLVEFDTWYNQEFDDPPTPHVGINNNSIISLTTATFDFDTINPHPALAVITYHAASYNLNVCWSFNATPNTNTCLSYQIDLSKCLPEFVVVGFSAGTGIYLERHVIHSWGFTSSLNDQLDSQSQGDPTATKQRKFELIITTIILSTTSVLIVFAIVVGCFIRDRKKIKLKYKRISTVELDLDRAAIPRRFYYQELVAATNGFASDTRLGRGGSGQVYKGILTDSGRSVAVKRIFLNFQNSETVFINEVKIISRLIHKNLVQFIGWCHEGGEFLLVFEYMPNGSLDTHLFGKKPILPWSVRYKIALGVVTAIHYLHEEVEQCVLHRDIKSANILLDIDFCTKLGDFGVALMLVDPSRLKSHQMTGSLVGTYGYLAPEYAKEGKASKESDMYSFGVVALEIACGRRTYYDGEYHVSLVNWVWQHYVEGTILNVADERLRKDGFDEKEMECMLIVGLWCTHPKDKERPRAEQVIKALRNEAKLPMLPKDMHDCSACSPSVAHSNSYQSQPITTSLSNIGR